MKKIILTLLCVLTMPIALMAAGDNDVTQQANVIYIENATIGAGTSTSLQAKLKTEVEAVAFQFDLFLPEGVYLNSDASKAISGGSLLTKKHVADAAWLKSGACRVICYSLSNEALKQSQGTAAIIHVDVDSKMKPGSYPVVLRNVEIAQANGRKSRRISEVRTTLTIVPNSDLPTDINQVEAISTIQNDGIYNLSGQKVDKLQPGQIGIVKGKKIIANEEGQP
ncbi:MAG: hypothetical protein J6E29_07615 [Prevotella sp.]|nr:hypothetical protein [Prevotella sp.]